MKILVAFLCLMPAYAQSLHYAINWPGGATLGEASLGAQSSSSTTAGTATSWQFNLDVDASIPGFTIRDQYHSKADANLCTIEVDKNYQHGTRKADEKIAVDQASHSATRTPQGGTAAAPFTVGSCARDPLTFLQFVRNELAQGRIAAGESLIFGSVYNVGLANTGAEPVRMGAKVVPADRISVSVQGPATALTVEILFAQDAARTPVLVRIPLSMGVFTADLVQ